MLFSAILALSSLSCLPHMTHWCRLTERTKLGLSAGAAEETGRKHLTEGQPNVTTMPNMPQAKYHSDLKLLR